MFVTAVTSELRLREVSYCLVGGIAVNLHGIPRMTYDIDIAVTMTTANLQSCDEALRALGLTPRLPISLADAADVATATAWEQERNLIAFSYADAKNPLHEVDVIIAPSLDPNGTVQRAVFLGQQLAVASVDDLIRLKLAAHRQQDLADVEHLQRIRK